MAEACRISCLALKTEDGKPSSLTISSGYSS